jgi:mannose-6-phosphate isomerase-like protein (cupin superfamily)
VKLPQAGDQIDKPWGWERVIELNDRYCIKHVFVRENQRLSKQYHRQKHETLILVSGTATLLRGDAGGELEEISMAVDVPYVIEPGTVHRVVGLSDPGALILEVSTPELEDVVRLEDDFGRIA